MTLTVPFSDRSADSIWFFSFLVTFSQVKKDHGNVIILLDEPGLNLHGRAQADLLRYIEEMLRPEHQVIFTTHSPFMVPADRLDWVRTVEDVVIQKGQKFISLGMKSAMTSSVQTEIPCFRFRLRWVTRSPRASSLVSTRSSSRARRTFCTSKPYPTNLRRGRVNLDQRWTAVPRTELTKLPRS